MSVSESWPHHRLGGFAVTAALFLGAHVAAAETPTGAPAPAAQQTVIKDATESNAYTAALNLSDPAQKAAALEAFLTTYPASAAKLDALDQMMVAYQQAGDTDRVEATARRILEAEPNHVRALAIVVFLERSRATAKGDAALADDAGARAEAGLKALEAWPRQAAMSEADEARVRLSMTAIFQGALGFRALQHKDWAEAKRRYSQAILAGGDDLTNVYQLSIAELEAQPIDPEGFWWAARAWSLAGAANNSAAQASIEKYAKAKYRRYHGGEDGWDAITAQAAAGGPVPEGFAVKPAPTPAELAVMAVAQYGADDLSFSDWEFILSMRDASPANADAAAKVWVAIQAKQAGGKRLQIPVLVISVQPGGLDVAIAEDNQKSGVADMHVILDGPAQPPPKAGAMIQVVGVISAYSIKPVRFTMEHGSIAP
jgi:hypothetical protein